MEASTPLKSSRLRIVVASPSDVSAERELVSVVVAEVNRWFGGITGLLLEVLRWETDTYPGFHAQGPQGLIDSILRIEDSDVVVAVFWKRFGTPTLESQSGTEHEIRRALASHSDRGRPQIMVYFNQSPYTPQSRTETDQWGRVLEFRRSLPGLWWPYNGPADFERQFRNHLLNMFREMLVGGNPHPSRALKKFLLLPPAPGLFFGRENSLKRIKELLDLQPASGSPPSERRVVVRGWPGVGKSSAAAAIAHDPNVREAFPEGVLWASLGAAPNLLRILSLWGRALGVDDVSSVATLNEAIERITEILTDKRLLLIVDDLWEAAHAACFDRLRGRCSTLYTTRETALAQAIVAGGGAVYNLPVLEENDAIELLGFLAPSAITSRAADCRQLALELECLPLALHVAGRTLEAEAQFGWGLDSMLAAMRDGAAIVRRKAPINRTDVERQTLPTVAALLQQSTDRLDPLVRDCYSCLGPFASRPATFDVAALKNVWEMDDPRPIIRELVNRGLMEAVGGGRFQMHALLVAHARSLLEDAAAQGN